MSNVAIIRDRGQLTIPDNIRKVTNWITPSSVVSITKANPDEITIRPHRAAVDPDVVWENIRQARAIVGKGKLSGLEIISHDRLHH